MYLLVTSQVIHFRGDPVLRKRHVCPNGSHAMHYEQNLQAMISVGTATGDKFNKVFSVDKAVHI